jgi:hypothetical protein
MSFVRKKPDLYLITRIIILRRGERVRVQDDFPHGSSSTCALFRWKIVYEIPGDEKCFCSEKRNSDVKIVNLAFGMI